MCLVVVGCSEIFATLWLFPSLHDSKILLMWLIAQAKSIRWHSVKCDAVRLGLGILDLFCLYGEYVVRRESKDGEN
jgi:hypothetical protein